MKKNKNARLRDKLSSKKEILFKEEIKATLESGVQNSNEEDFPETKGERSLWRAVITQALMDAGSESKKREAKFERAQATAWLSSSGVDFVSVCVMAGLDPSYVKSKARKAISRGCAWRRDEIKEKKRQNRLVSIRKAGAKSGASLVRVIEIKSTIG